MRLVYNGTHWDDDDEAIFLRYLGRWSMAGRIGKAKRITLLKSYRDAMRLREVWGEMNPDAVRRTVEKEIAMEEEKE